MYLYACTHVHAHAQTHAHTNRKTHTATKINFYLLDMLISQFYPHTPPLTTSTILITRGE
uniref:Uncharacterized protein n=1 Tax=Anguilla anguilla TaxID=7936 RepID=A0A0E9U1V0_ANGAN